jgi:hypothetical protein
MQFVRFLKEKVIYILVNLLIFLIGYIFIKAGIDKNSNDKIGAVFISIGTSLIAAGVVAVLDLWKNLSITNIFYRINNVLYLAGIEYYYDKRDLDKYDDLMKNMKENLDICGYSLVAFFDSYSDLLIKKINDNCNLHVRILLVDPDSEFSKNRATQEGHESNDFKNKIQRMKNKFSDIENVQMKKISSPLSTMIFRIDDVMFIGPHFYKKTSKSTITYELNNKGKLFAEYQNEFERMWSDSSIC